MLRLELVCTLAVALRLRLVTPSRRTSTAQGATEGHRDARRHWQVGFKLGGVADERHKGALRAYIQVAQSAGASS